MPTAPEAAAGLGGGCAGRHRRFPPIAPISAVTGKNYISRHAQRRAPPHRLRAAARCAAGIVVRGGGAAEVTQRCRGERGRVDFPGTALMEAWE